MAGPRRQSLPALCSPALPPSPLITRQETGETTGSRVNSSIWKDRFVRACEGVRGYARMCAIYTAVDRNTHTRVFDNIYCLHITHTHTHTHRWQRWMRWLGTCHSHNVLTSPSRNLSNATPLLPLPPPLPPTRFLLTMGDKTARRRKTAMEWGTEPWQTRQVLSPCGPKVIMRVCMCVCSPLPSRGTLRLLPLALCER